MPRGSAPGERRGGRQKGTLNKQTTALKDMILAALAGVGGIEYLKRQAEATPQAFMTLVGKVLPLQVTGENGGAIVYQWLDSPKDDPSRLNTGQGQYGGPSTQATSGSASQSRTDEREKPSRLSMN